ncbi:hypothetical protein M011DRAFT_454492 [Sporormia fimetaria CBS 119925]|uniref:DUF3433 domain containing protein n=1 Tax=Sporormia fimetaria CBS 119925 TaxID=1340428 RepID=A0A6A6UUZ3_9PLEO|nr:hypothetical protein M011DRAFT_454492 [Sporormia fimetaria CBS 119925]
MSHILGVFAPPWTRRKSTSRHTWDPPALRWRILSLLVLVCWAFIAVLQYFLTKSQTDGGVIFALNVNNDIPLRRSFMYLYFPTTAAVIFSIYMAWVDLDAKRFEPYYQLSKPGGALGKDSLLLHYPNMFIPFAPFYALKNRHWLVFWASTATILAIFGIVPLQAGIFSTKVVTRTFPQSFTFSSVSDQEAVKKLAYQRSAYGILMLNETMPAFTTHNFTLAPFAAIGVDTPMNSRWIANTTLYNLDLQCEDARPQIGVRRSWSRVIYFNSTRCSYEPEYVLAFGNDTVGTEPSSEEYGMDLIPGAQVGGRRVKGFDAIYSGADANAVSFGGILCQDELALEDGTFFVALAQNKAKADDPPHNGTALFCRPLLFEQAVVATVDAMTQAPLSTVPLEPKRPLSPGLFNTTIFQRVLAGYGRYPYHRENTLPGLTAPSYLDQLSGLDLSLVVDWDMMNGETHLHRMAQMALTISKRSLTENLDPNVLAETYETAYRLLFSLAVADTLKPDFSVGARQVRGQREERTEAVVLEPVFTYLVEALLGTVSLLAFAMMYMRRDSRRQSTLVCDPGTIAVTMSLVAGKEPLLSSFADFDTSATKHLEESVRHRRYQLVNDTCTIEEAQPPTNSSDLPIPGDLQIAKPTRPAEFRLFTVIPSTLLFASLAIAGAVLFVKSKPHGLPLPSNKPLVQNIVRAYIPTALATLIEPMWIWVNRLLCMLQPLQELRDGRAPASKSINLNYSSLPPQLTILKALRAGHFVLASVCAMALLANLLAVSFAGLLFQDSPTLSKSMLFPAPFEAKFVEVNGAAGPRAGYGFDGLGLIYSGAFQGGTGEDQFLVAESNYTKGTPLPAWTDERALYLPFFDSNSMSQTGSVYQARTKYFSAELSCNAFSPDLVLDPDGFQLWDNDTDITLGSLSRTRMARQPLAGLLPMLSTETVLQRKGIRSFGSSPRTADLGICRSTVVVGWVRLPQNDSAQIPNSNNTLFLTCRPRIIIGDATVTVNSAGRLIESVRDRTPNPADSEGSNLEKYFTNGALNLIGQSNQFLFRSTLPYPHNDTLGSYAAEFMHHFINRAANHTRITNPNEPVPKFSDVEAPLKAAYSRLFAIWLSINKDLLLVPAGNSTETTIMKEVKVIYKEERLFFKTSMFIISEIILGIYIITAVVVYLRRPGRFLPRMPTTIAAIIALFAASAAVEDMRGTSQFTTEEHEQYLNKLGCRYGYGSYVGRDGCVHVGIEKAPFVKSKEKTTFEHSRFDGEKREMALAVVEDGSENDDRPGWWARLWPRPLYQRAGGRLT